jgi:hypothetical protein
LRAGGPGVAVLGAAQAPGKAHPTSWPSALASSPPQRLLRRRRRSEPPARGGRDRGVAGTSAKHPCSQAWPSARSHRHADRQRHR